MVALGRKNLFAEKTRLLISVGGVAFSVLLIVVLFGLYQGLNDMLVSYVNSVDADIWVAQSGSTDMFHGISLIPKDVEGQLIELPEVKRVDALVGRQVAFSVDGKEAHTFLMGYDTSRHRWSDQYRRGRLYPATRADHNRQSLRAQQESGHWR